MDHATALLLIDVQVGLDDPRWGSRNNPDAEVVLAQLLERWRRHGWPVIHVQHLSQEPDSPLRPGQPGVDLKPVVRPRPSEPVIQKQVNCAFIGTDLEARLRAAGIRRLVVGGLTTDHCVSTTVRMAANLGFDTIVVADATATFSRTGADGREWTARDMHDAALASLHGEFATVRTAAELLHLTEPPPTPA
ncbi:MAG: cysteine hydrolase family protein [Gemmatimonadales bacterium]